jgi:hypothetical protein
MGDSPARGYSWPPFEPGNTKALTHGAYSENVIEARAAIVRNELLELCLHLDEPAFAPAVARFLRAETRALLLHDWITKTVNEKGAGAVKAWAWEQAAATDRLAAQIGQTLGLDPIGQARIAALATSAEIGQETLADHRERGRQAIERREQRQAVDVDTSDATEAD